MRRIVTLCLMVAFVLLPVAVFAKTKVELNRTNKSLDVKWLRSNGFWMTVNNFGQHAVKEGAFTAGGYWAYQAETAQYIYGAGIWIGAMVSGTPHVTNGYDPSDGSSEFSPGEIGASLTDASWKVYLSSDADWPLASTKSVLDTYAVFNDADTNPSQGPSGGNHFPLNVEVSQTSYEWNYGANNDIVFLIYDIANKGNTALNGLYVAVVCDPDIGEATDDLVGFDQDHNVGYAYDNDGEEAWGHAGYIGYDFLKATDPEHPSTSLGMTAFKIFSINVAPATDAQRYNLMSGHNMAGTIAEAFDTDSGPADKRFMLCTGPMTLAPVDPTDDEQVDNKTQVVIAIFPGYELGSDSQTSVAGADGRNYKTLIGNSDIAQGIFDLNYFLPFAPAKPNATALALDKRVYIEWDNIAEVTPDPYYAVASDPTSPFYDDTYAEYDFAGYLPFTFCSRSMDTSDYKAGR